MDWIDRRLDRLARSRFRNSFRLTEEDQDYIRRKGWFTLSRHAHSILSSRLAAAFPKNDGRQTPWRGHPVFVAQHATATCCRKCVERWHGIPRGRELSTDEIALLTAIVLRWILRRIDMIPNATNADTPWPQLTLPLD